MSRDDLAALGVDTDEVMQGLERAYAEESYFELRYRDPARAFDVVLGAVIADLEACEEAEAQGDLEEAARLEDRARVAHAELRELRTAIYVTHRALTPIRRPPPRSRSAPHELLEWTAGGPPHGHGVEPRRA